MKTNLNYIGIDVSKDTLDICILSKEASCFVINNTPKAIKSFFKAHLQDGQSYHVCAENTGRYTWKLMEILPELSCVFYLVNPLHIKKSLGLVRGKSDKIDAMRIAQFIKKNHDNTPAYLPKSLAVEQIQILLSERRFRVEERKKLRAKNKEYYLVRPEKLAKKLMISNTVLIKVLTEQISALEAQIKELIAEDQYLSSLATQLLSVPGVGHVLAWKLMVTTNAFKTINNPRKFACYAGVAPFSHTSGISVFGKNRVSIYGDKSLKKLLHLAAMSAIRLDNDLGVFYRRKVEEGKNKMSVLNAVRNKIIHIIFALVKNQTFYQNRLVTS